MRGEYQKRFSYPFPNFVARKDNVVVSVSVIKINWWINLFILSSQFFKSLYLIYSSPSPPSSVPSDNYAPHSFFHNITHHISLKFITFHHPHLFLLISSSFLLHFLTHILSTTQYVIKFGLRERISAISPCKLGWQPHQTREKERGKRNGEGKGGGRGGERRGAYLRDPGEDGGREFAKFGEDICVFSKHHVC